MLATMTLATSMAAREGPVPMAGHQICLQVWLAISLLTDALALSGQVNGHDLNFLGHFFITKFNRISNRRNYVDILKSITGALMMLCTIDFWKQRDRFKVIMSGMPSLCWTLLHHEDAEFNN